MRRWVVLILSVGILGFVLTVLNAWACEFVTEHWQIRDASTRVQAEWPAKPPSGWPAAPEHLIVHESLLRTKRIAVGDPVGPAIPTLSVTSHGWPMRSMYRQSPGLLAIPSLPNRDASGQLILPSPNYLDGWNVKWNAGWLASITRGSKWSQFVFPLAILPPGFAVNWLLHTSIVLMLVLASNRLLAPLRRAAWRRRGLCSGCGYAIGDLAVCPECGEGA